MIPNGFSFMFNAFPIIVAICFFLILILILTEAIKNLLRWGRNNQSPILSVLAVIVSKRTKITKYNNGGNDMNTMRNVSTYYITFELESKDRMEFKVSSEEFGLLCENDVGKLTFQGTRFLGFKRMKEL